jgi:predicted transcriptional regulator
MDRKLIWWIFAVSKGGKNRSRIVKILKGRPSSISQLARDLNRTYHDTRYHIKILQENNVVESIGDASIAMYFLTEEFEKDWEEFEKIWKSLKIS